MKIVLKKNSTSKINLSKKSAKIALPKKETVVDPYAEKQKEIRKIKVRGELQDAFDEALKNVLDEQIKKYDAKFDTYLHKLKDEGLLYKAEYMELTMSDIAKKGIKNLGRQGWRYCFSVGEEDRQKFIFQKPSVL